MKKDNIFIALGFLTFVMTVGGVTIQVGSFKGQIQTTLADHKERILKHDTDIDHLRGDVSDIKARIHGVASQIGKLPNKVAEKVTQTYEQE